VNRRETWSAQPTTAVVVNCRHCLHHQSLTAERVTTWTLSRDPQAWYRCRSCENWFRIRWADAVNLGVVQPLVAAG
jgi:hypothetical protein